MANDVHDLRGLVQNHDVAAFFDFDVVANEGWRKHQIAGTMNVN